LCLLTVKFKFEDKAFRVVVDTYVSDADGTGIVHQAPAFGEDDHRIAMANGVLAPEDMPPCPIDDRGHFTQEVPDFVGLHVKVKLFMMTVYYISNIFHLSKGSG
jgi:isoleucyl-tRNA synthetase